ncbi:hypothetical protein BC940DRAFT_336228 [Gongronella butleri]|nr:hypothetical protein BC940DRAFT_336228 [Gongronella butleri]
MTFDRILFQRECDASCPKAAEMHRFTHLWSILLCQWNDEVYRAMYDMILFTKHAHSCGCGAPLNMDAFLDYIKKFGAGENESRELMIDVDLWLANGPNQPPKDTSPANLYACGMFAWLCAHAYGGRILRGKEYIQAGDLLLQHCLYERVLVRKRKMDSGVDVKVRRLPLEYVCHQVITHRIHAFQSLAGQDASSDLPFDLAKMLAIHSLGYLWIYDPDSLQLLLPQAANAHSELVDLALNYENTLDNGEKQSIAHELIDTDVFRLSSALWDPVDTMRSDTSHYIAIHGLFSNQALGQITCNCLNHDCSSRIQRHMAIALFVNGLIQNPASRQVGMVDFHAEWQQLALQCNGCTREMSALLFSATSALWYTPMYTFLERP